MILYMSTPSVSRKIAAVIANTKMKRERIECAGGEAGLQIDRSCAEVIPSANRIKPVMLISSWYHVSHAATSLYDRVTVKLDRSRYTLAEGR
jgi:hypothetical protein